MKTITNTIPGYRTYEYLLVLNIPEELKTRIMKVKEHFAETFKTDQVRKNIPFITLASFTQYEMMEERISNRLGIVAMSSPAFKVELKDFGSFPSHTIYINIMSKIPFQFLVKNIRAESQRLMKMNDDHKPHFILEPYITIARKLQPWQYEKGWLEYSHKHFTGRFIADSMTLLKRAEGEMKYSLVKKFAFQNLPVLTKQGELFG